MKKKPEYINLAGKKVKIGPNAVPSHGKTDLAGLTKIIREAHKLEEEIAKQQKKNLLDSPTLLVNLLLELEERIFKLEAKE